jgi:hypothetical protein
MAKLKIAKTNSVTSQEVDSYTGPLQITSSGTTDYPGAVGGDKIQVGPQIHAQVRVTGQSAAEGSILRQKGAHKHYVMDAAGHKGVCKLVNKAKASLAEGEMSIVVTKADSTTFYASKITNRWVWDFSTTPKKYRYWHNATATTSNNYATDAAAGVVGFVSVPDAA